MWAPLGLLRWGGGAYLWVGYCGSRVIPPLFIKLQNYLDAAQTFRLFTDYLKIFASLWKTSIWMTRLDRFQSIKLPGRDLQFPIIQNLLGWTEQVRASNMNMDFSWAPWYLVFAQILTLFSVPISNLWCPFDCCKLTVLFWRLCMGLHLLAENQFTGRLLQDKCSLWFIQRVQFWWILFKHYLNRRR
jgi:hypothetical protein